MTARHREPARITLRMAIQRTGLSRKQIDRSISRSLVASPLSAGDLQDLRRIRRLQELGVNLDLTPERVGACIDKIGIGFLYAPLLHPAMKLSLIHISEPTRPFTLSRMPSSA